MSQISPVYQTRAASACDHCAGTDDHESWCILENPNVYYAFNILLHPGEMTEQDRIILHALGVVWTPLLTDNSSK